VHLSELAHSLPILVCQTTVRKVLHELGLHNRIAVKKPYLNQRQKEQRLCFVKGHKDWTIGEWSSVIWSDEASFEMVRIHVKSKYGGVVMRDMIHSI